MPAMTSSMLPLGTDLPEFSLPDAASGQRVNSHAAAQGKKGTLVMFICNHCPYVLHIRDALVPLANRAVNADIQVLAINANSEQTHPQDGPGPMRAVAQSMSFQFPFLFDATQEVAKRFDAQCTPEFYLFDQRKKLFYRGQFDDSRPSNGKPVTGRDLQAALDALVEHQPPPEPQIPSVGCSIKWHPAN